MVVNNYKLRLGEYSDIPQLINLMQRQYGIVKSEEYFIWQFFKSAYPTVLVIAEIKETIVGMFGLQRRILNNSYIVGQAIDMLVSKDYRGLGIFSNMIDYAVDNMSDIDLLFVLPNLSGKNAVEKLNWLTVGRIDDLVLYKEDYSKSNDYFNSFIIDKTNNQLNSFEYSRSIVNWRFNIHPENNYSILSNNKGEAYLKIFYDDKNDIKFGDIVFIEMNNTYFINEIVSFFKNKDVQAISTWALPNTLRYSLFLNAGFNAFQRERFLCYRTIGKPIKYLDDLNYWDLHQSDAEFY